MSANQQKPKSRYSVLFDPANVILTLGLVLSLGFLVSYSRANVSLARENSRLKESVSRLSTLEPGDVVPAFEGLDLDGKPANVSYSGKQKHLLFIFSTNCAACAKQIPVWAGIVTPAKEKNCIVQGVSVDSVDDTRAFFADKDQAFDIIVPQRSILRMYRTAVIPQVLLISPQGTVDWVKNGSLTEDQIQDLLSKI